MHRKGLMMAEYVPKHVTGDNGVYYIVYFKIQGVVFDR
jgi:hypothetical protein